MAIENVNNAAQQLSYADYLKLPAEPRGELFDGEFIVTPSPLVPHQAAVGCIYVALTNYLEAHPEVGEAFVAPLDVILRADRPAVVLQPDVLFISASRRDIIKDVVHGAPDLVVEVVSPAGSSRDAVRKRALYERHGVREYWLVWPEEERVDVLRRAEGPGFGEPWSLEREDTLTTALLPGFELPVARVFARR